MNREGGMTGMEIGGSDNLRNDDLLRGDLLSRLIEFIPYPFHVINVRDYTIHLSNITGPFGESLKGRTCHSVSHKNPKPCDDPQHPCPISEIKKTRAPVKLEHLHYDKGGEPKSVEILCYPIFGPGGELEQVVEYVFDITERKRLHEQRRRHEFIVNAARDFMVLLNRRLIFEAANSAFCEALEKDYNQVIGNTVAGVMGHRIFNDMLAGPLGECLAGKIVRREAWLTLPGPGTLFLDIACYPYAGEDGTVTHAAVIARDITERRRFEENLQSYTAKLEQYTIDLDQSNEELKLKEAALCRSEDKFRKAFRFTPAGVIIRTLMEGIYMEVNDAYLRMTGYTRDEVIGHSDIELGIWVDQAERNEIMREIATAGEIVNREVRLKMKSGEIKTMLWSADLIDCGAGEKCLIAVAQDYTEKKRAQEELREEVTTLKQYLLSDHLDHEEFFAPVITVNKNMRAIFKYAEIISASTQPVLIMGETGVGKELFATIIHRLSGRTGEFVALNVAGLDDTMFSDTLFGHRKGAFTGAETAREGLIARASDGTLFLDEIGDLAMASQVKLLRLLDEHAYYPLGADTCRQSNARIIMASNRDIHALIQEGRFRKDLYYRIFAHQISIPPLRERKEDIPFLLDEFFREAGESFDRKTAIKPPARLVTLLDGYHFPGNVRELKAMVFDSVARHSTGKDMAESFVHLMQGKAVSGGIMQTGNSSRFPTLKETEERLIAEALQLSRGNQSSAADMLGISSQALNKRLRRKKKQPL